MPLLNMAVEKPGSKNEERAINHMLYLRFKSGLNGSEAFVHVTVLEKIPDDHKQRVANHAWRSLLSGLYNTFR